jgi:hypothetical protein
MPFQAVQVHTDAIYLFCSLSSPVKYSQRNRVHARRFRLRQKNKAQEQKMAMTPAETNIAIVDLKSAPPTLSVSDEKVQWEEHEALRRYVLLPDI